MASSGGRRRGKWAPPSAAPTPRMLLRLPRRSRAAAPRRSGTNLGTLFAMERRARAAAAAAAAAAEEGEYSGEEEGEGEGEEEGEGGGGGWRFQAEILRAECNFLRMEREVAQREVERQRARVEASLKSAVETLVSGRKKIDGRSGDGAAGAALQEEIRELEEQIEELNVVGKEGGTRGGGGGGGGRSMMRGRCRELQRSRGRNFDRQASALRHRLEKMAGADADADADPPCKIKEIREIALPALRTGDSRIQEEIDRNVDRDRRCSDVEMLKRKMEGLSKGMLERVAEYGCLLSNSNSNTNSNSNSNSNSKSGGNSKRSVSQWSNGCHHQQQVMAEECSAIGPGGCCDCRKVVNRIMQQVRAESEQWTEMQAMLEQVRLEMQELQSSRDIWERRAVASEISVRSLHAQMLEWKHRARVSECSVDELQKHVSELQNKLLHSVRLDLFSPSFSSREHSETQRTTPLRIKSQQKKKSADSNKENEKHVLVCRVKSSRTDVSNRSPLQDIGNFSRLQQR